MSEHDEATATALRRLAAAHAPVDGWQPDAHAVLRRGRHLRIRRVTGAASAGALVLALAIGLPAVLSGRGTPVPPGRPTAAATTVAPPTRAVGDGAVAELEDGFAAVNVPSRVSAQQLHADGVAGYAVDVVQTGDDVHVRLAGGDTLLDASISLTDGGSPTSYGHAGTAYPNLAEYGRGNSSPVSVFVGVLPSWQRDPTAYLFSSAGWPYGTDGLVSHTAEVPTFHPPADDGRLMYVVVVGGDARTALLGSPHTVAFAGADGDAFWPECGRSTGTGTAEELGTCAGMLGVSEDGLWFTLTRAFDRLLGAPGSSPTASGADTPPAPAPTEVASGVLVATGPGAPQADGRVSVGTFDGFVAWIGRDGSDSDSMTMLSLVSPDGGAVGAEPLTKQPLGPWATVGYSVGLDIGPSAGWFVYGTVPPDLADARVFLYSPRGFPQADGPAVPVLPVPTFRMPPMANNPIEDGRGWFVAGFNGGAIDAVRSDSGFPFAAQVVFAGADGTLEDSSCQTVDSPCQGQERTDADSRAAYAAIREIVAQGVGSRG